MKKYTQVLSYVVWTQVRRHVHKKITKRRYREEKLGRFVFRKPVLFTFGLGLTTPYSLGIWVWIFYQTFENVFFEVWVRLDSQIHPTRFAINFLFTTARAERKVHLCVKLFDIFPRSILICLTRNLSLLSQIQSRFLCGVLGKYHFGRIFQKFCANQGYPLPKLVKFTLLSTILFWVCIARKSFTRVLSCVVCTQVRTHVNKQITKRRYGEEKPGCFLFGKRVLFTLGLGLTTPYSLGIWVRIFYQTFDIVSIKFWLRFDSHIRPTKFGINFLFTTARAQRKNRLCVKLFDFFPRSILIRLPWNLLHFVPNLVLILTWNFRKKLFRDNFSKFLCKPRLSHLTKLVKFRSTQQFYYVSVLRWKKFTQVLSYVVFIQVGRHVHKQITKRRYGEEKPGRFVFGNPVLFTLGLGLTTPYSLGVWVWILYQKFDNVSIEFLLRLDSQIRPTIFAINFLFTTARAERIIRLCVNLFDFFPWSILIHLSWNLSHFVPNSVEILTSNFRKKLFRENLSEILCKQGLSSTKTCEISPYFQQFYSVTVLHWNNSDKYFHMLCAPR